MPLRAVPMQMPGRRGVVVVPTCLVLLSNILHELTAAVDFLPVFDYILIQVLQFVAHISAQRFPLSKLDSLMGLRQTRVVADFTRLRLAHSGRGFVTTQITKAGNAFVFVFLLLFLPFVELLCCYWRAFNSCKLVLTPGNWIAWVIC